MRAGQVSVAVLIDKFVSATALIKFQEVQQTLSLRKDKEVCFSPTLQSPPASPPARKAASAASASHSRRAAAWTPPLLAGMATASARGIGGHVAA